MKKIISQVLVFAFVFVLVQNGGPGATKEHTYYSGGKSNTTTTESSAHVFQTIGEAYAKQLELGNEWRIETR